ncbi:unnamed protein product [Trichogramma brassicae]|uniref:Uncharacterized protein n=1 Tax=Trichogramma brassicae TaxID=86971 RepID=A0A6H5ISG7_9HYME|nr:unnamed protein product [Trichogramma brassicae]
MEFLAATVTFVKISPASEDQGQGTSSTRSHLRGLPGKSILFHTGDPNDVGGVRLDIEISPASEDQGQGTASTRSHLRGLPGKSILFHMQYLDASIENVIRTLTGTIAKPASHNFPITMACMVAKSNTKKLHLICSYHRHETRSSRSIERTILFRDRYVSCIRMHIVHCSYREALQRLWRITGLENWSIMCEPACVQTLLNKNTKPYATMVNWRQAMMFYPMFFMYTGTTIQSKFQDIKL